MKQPAETAAEVRVRVDVAAGSGMMRALRHRDFRRLWLGFGIAVLGFQVQRVGLGFLAYEITGSALVLALVFSGDSIPMIFLSPFGGVLSDRWDRKALLIASRVGVALLALLVAVLVATDAIATWHLLIFALLTGIGYALDVPARQAMIHDLVPAEDLVNAIALTSILRQLSRIVGPAIGSLVLLAASSAGTFALMAFAQILTVGMVATIRLPWRAPAVRAAGEGAVRAVLTSLTEGLRFIAGRRGVLLMLAISTVPSFTAMAYQSLTPVFAEDVLGEGEAAIGLMLTAAGAGALAGSVLIAARPALVARPAITALTAIGFGLAVTAFALSSRFPLSLALLALVGLTGALYSVGSSSIVQQQTPAAFQGRVMGVYQTTWEFQVFGALLVGALADQTNAQFALALAGGVSACLVGALFLLRQKESGPHPRPLPR